METKRLRPKYEPISCNQHDAANLLGVSLSTFHKMERAGLIKSIQLDRRKLYSIKQLHEFVDGAVA